MIDGDVPSPINPPSGCAFHTRCRYVMDRCKVERPALLMPARGMRWRAGSMRGRGGRSEIYPRPDFHRRPGERRDP